MNIQNLKVLKGETPIEDLKVLACLLWPNTILLIYRLLEMQGYKVAVRWVVDAHQGIVVYSEKRNGSKLGLLKQGSYFHEKQRIGRWIQQLAKAIRP